MTTFWVKRPRRKFMKQEIANCMKFRKELTKYSYNDDNHTCKLDSWYVNAEENWICQMKCFPAYNKNSSHTSQTPTWHSRKRVEQSMVLIRGNSILSKPKNLSEKTKQIDIKTSILDRFQSQPEHNNWREDWSKYFFHTNIRTLAITHNVSPERDRYAAFYLFRYHPNCGREALWKVVQTIMVLRGQLSAWTQKGGLESADRIKKKWMPRWSGSIKTWMAGLVITRLEMALCSPRTLRCKSYTNASPRIRRRPCLGKPRRMDSDIWQLVVSIQVDRRMLGEIRMDLE